MKKLLTIVLAVCLMVSGFQTPTHVHAATFSANVTPSGDTLTFTWTNMGNRTYYIYRQNQKFYEPVSDWDYVGQVKGKTKYVYKIPKADKKYDWVYTVTYKSGGEMRQSNHMSVWHHLSKNNPKITSASVKNGRVSLKWSRVCGNGYRLYHRVPGGKWERVTQRYYTQNYYTTVKYKKGTHYFMVRPFLYTTGANKKLGGKSPSMTGGNIRKVIIK